MTFLPEPSPEFASAVLTSIPLAQGESPVRYSRSPKARRYLLTVRAAGEIHVTLPRSGARAEAIEFVRSRIAWIERQLERQRQRGAPPKTWKAGTEILLRGEKLPLELASSGEGRLLRLGLECWKPAAFADDLRPAVEKHLQALARKELVPRAEKLAREQGCPLRRVSVRNQRSRWGSCSRSGTVSLNWRLIHAPGAVRDYVILHELMHFREMNHSPRFWAQVERACPDFKAGEAWLKAHSWLLWRA